jgi:DNA-binding LacI/PurR family transcriptional regulator
LHVSPSTVSRALQDHPDISSETKKAIWELAHKLDYSPNSIAAGLRKNKTYTLGVIVPEIVHYFFSSIISGIEDIAYKNGYKVIICQSNENYEREVINLNTLISGRVDGVLMSLSKQTSQTVHFKHTLDRGIPLVFFDRICADLKTSRVVVDDYEGAFNAVEHLIDQGCRRIAHLAGPETLLICKERKRGYADALKKHDIKYDESLVVLAHNKNDVLTATSELMRRKSPPDAFFAVNDNVAAGSMVVLKNLGFKIPKDVAIVGFTDDPGICTIVDPPLSSVHQPAYEIGLESTKILLDFLESGIDNNETITLKPSLVVRESSLKRQI